MGIGWTVLLVVVGAFTAIVGGIHIQTFWYRLQSRRLIAANRYMMEATREAMGANIARLEEIIQLMKENAQKKETLWREYVALITAERKSAEGLREFIVRIEELSRDDQPMDREYARITIHAHVMEAIHLLPAPQGSVDRCAALRRILEIAE